MKNKIVHVTSVHSALDVRIFHKEAKTLAHAGLEVAVIAQYDKNETVEGIRILALPKIENRIRRILILNLRAFWIGLRQKADVYHLHDPELLPVGIFLKLTKAKKVIYDVHEDYGKQVLSKLYIPRIIRKELGFLVRITEYFCSKLFDAIITATDDILRNFYHHKRAVSVKNFPIFTNFSIRRNNRNGENAVFSLIYVGGLDEIRGITQIIKALEFFNSDNQLKLTLCGHFYPPHYEREIKGLEGFKRVEYLGWLEANEIPDLLGRHDAGIVCFLPEPNHISAMPNKIFEYMAAGLPVIASSFPLWKEIVEGHRCGICVDPLNPLDIAEAIMYLMRHPESRKEMGRNGRETVLHKYNWEKEGKKLLDLYAQLLDR